MKAQIMRDNSTTLHIAFKKSKEINLKHFIMNKQKKKVAADKSDRTVQDTIWLLFDTFQLIFGFYLDEPTHYAGRIYRMIKFGQSI
eukprot:5775033-Heterocapsa_arctica.AAC.1